MSDVNTNKFGGALLFILGEFAAAEEEMIEDGGMEVFGEDDQGSEGSCEVSINELAQAASDEIKHLTYQLAKANQCVAELEKEVNRKRSAFEYVDKHASDMTRRLADVDEQLAKANERVDGLEKALANCADALYESNINHKKAINKIQAECIDVLFDFAAKRDDSGFSIALYEQPYEIQDAIRTFKQLSKDQSNG